MANSTASDTNGITGGFSGSLTENCLFSAFIAVAWYNSIELVVLCFATFKVWRGCYFWSLLISSASIVPLCLGFLFKFFNIVNNGYIIETLANVFWYGMVTGQSMVLWSRLHLLLNDRRILRATLCMIIIDAIVLGIPSVVLSFGANATTHPQGFVEGYKIWEHVQLIGFSVQETILSGIYIWKAVEILKVHADTRYRSMLHQLVLINILIISLDGGVIAVEYAGFYAIQVTFKPMVYSIKLKLEYAILGKLVSLVQASRTTESHPSEPSVEHSSITEASSAVAGKSSHHEISVENTNGNREKRDEARKTVE
jgi:hypothetical protein